MKHFDEVAAGEELPVLVKEAVSRVQLARYAGASGDFNPIHLDEPYAQAAGMGGVIAHGMLSMAFLAEAVTRWSGPASVARIEARFKAIVRPGDSLTVRGSVVEKNEADRTVRLKLTCENQDGVTVTEGAAVVRL
jgi:acyl dehydratase